MTRFSTRVLAALQEKTNAIVQATDAACNPRLNPAHRQGISLAKVAV